MLQTLWGLGHDRHSQASQNRVTTEEAEEFFKTIQKADYSVIQQLNKSPTQISILALLLSIEVHHEALQKVLKETHLPTNIIDSSFKAMISLVLATNQVSFSDNDLPPERKYHTLALHIMVKCEYMIIARVLINNRSALNVCPMATL